MLLSRKKLRNILCCLLVVLGIGGVVYLLTPKPKLLEKYTYSTVIYDANNRLLNLGLSMDDKYRRFVPYQNIPPQAIEALLLYEDRFFFYHFGVNPLRSIKAATAMLMGSRKQGASTITMQLARILFDIDSSTLSGKIVQMLRAIQLEMFYSKEEILEAYFNLAPYGMNVEGIGAAGLVYFNTEPKDFNVHQILALTVVPQNPSKRGLANKTGQVEALAASKRLRQIWKEQYGDNSKLFDLPLYVRVNKPFHAPHLVQQLKEKYRGDIVTTINLDYQKWLEDVVARFVAGKHNLGVENAAAIIINRKDMSVLAKVGSNDFFNDKIKGQVDGTKAYRSPGSVMKPFIYAMALEQGIIHPYSQLKDVPRNFGTYMPENYDRSFYGMIDATSALIKSRNVPAVEVLLKVGVQNYYNFLQQAEVKKLKSPDFYGLALALGGYELTMENIAEMYAMLANRGEFGKLRFIKSEELSTPKKIIAPEAAFLTMDMLSKNYPADESYNYFAVKNNRNNIYWKTGTSFGYRDAWTAGVVGDYVIVVWLGNFDGTPNPSLIGQEMAAPLFFKVVRGLIKNMAIGGDDISANGLNLSKTNICRPTGDIADANCSKVIKSYFIPGVTKIKLSNISQTIPIDVNTGKRACRHRPPQTVMKNFEFWPSDVLNAYRAAGVSIRKPPEFGENCDFIETAHIGKPPLIFFPADGNSFIVNPQDLEQEKISLKASLDADAVELFWFWNGNLIGSSTAEQTLEVTPKMGKAEIRAVDDKGRFSKVQITVKPALSD